MLISPAETGKISDNLYAVRDGTVNFFVYKSGEDVICIDSGFRKNRINSGLDTLGIDPRKITHLFLTHSDRDHAGGLGLFPKAKIYLSADEEPLITGEKARMLGIIHNQQIKKSHNLLNDNDIISVGLTKIRAIATPGHTPGSMSFLVNGSILFVGDAFKLLDGKVRPPRSNIFNMDTKLQEESIRKLAALDNVLLACTAHTGCTAEFSNAIQAWRG
jgi:glyoxylase-like metal-dependent hydrolase (beta-lactamase superfamily II)